MSSEAAPPMPAAQQQQQQAAYPAAFMPAGVMSPQDALAMNAFHSASLYVGDLAPDVTEALLFDIFNAVGPVASIRVCRNAVTRRSLGYAYVNFHNQTDAERALDTMNYTLIKGQACRMMWSQRDPSLRKTGAGNVFVKNLDPSIDNKALYDTFSLFGDILSCKVEVDRNGRSKGYGFVHFETLESAEEAISKINGMLIAGREVFVGKFVKRNERPGMADWRNVFVKNIPLHWTKERLENEFSSCGPIGSAVIMLDEKGESRGFGFVDFVEHEGALQAVNTMNDKVVLTLKGEETGPEEDEGEGEEEEPEVHHKEEDEYYFEKKEDKTEEAKQAAIAAGLPPPEPAKKPKKKLKTQVLFVARAQKKSERERELAQKYEQLKTERLNKYQGVNLFVKNLAEEVDDDILRKEFAPFGTITSARVMRDAAQPGSASGEEGAAVSTPVAAAPAAGSTSPAAGPASPAAAGGAATAAPASGSSGLSPSKGFGFVCFTYPEEATKAVTEMNGKMLLGKPMYVALAQRKDARRAQLEAHHSQRASMARGMPMPSPMYPGAPMFYQSPGMPAPFARGMQANMYFQQPMMPGANRMQASAMPMAARGMQPISNYAGRPFPMAPTFNAAQAQGGMVGQAGQAGRGNNPRRNTRQAGGAGARQQRMPGVAMGVGPMMAMPKYPGQQRIPQEGVEPLTAAALANATDEQQKNMIGERLYPLIHNVQPNLAGKITGMLLEMDNPELLHLLESPDALNDKISEALNVLEQHQANAAGGMTEE